MTKQIIVMTLGLLIASSSVALSQDFGDKIAALVESAGQEEMSICQSVLEEKDGFKVAAVNCGLGQTCPDGNQCCRIGSSIWCCPSNGSCDYDNIVCK